MIFPRAHARRKAVAFGARSWRSAPCRHHHGRQRPLGQGAPACRASPGIAPAREAVRRILRAANKLGIECVTLYAFSSENWKRPEEEISDLTGLMKQFIRSELEEIHAGQYPPQDHRRSPCLRAGSGEDGRRGGDEDGRQYRVHAGRGAQLRLAG